MTVKLIGNDTLTGSAHYTTGIVVYQKSTALSSALLTEIRISAIHATNAMFAVYTDNAGEPGTLLASTSSAAVGIGDNTIPIGSISLVSGSAYWLGHHSNSATVLMQSTGGINMRWKVASYSGFSWPNPPSGLTARTDYSFQVSGWGTVGGRMCQVIIV